MKQLFTIIIGFLHDFAAGCWAAALLVTWRLQSARLPAEMQVTIKEMQREFFFIGIVCILVVIVAGAGTTFTYIGNDYGENAEKARRQLLIIKHVMLAVVFAAGTWWQYTMVYSR